MHAPPCEGYRFPAEAIAHAVCLYHRLPLADREAEELLFERGTTVTQETVRARCAPLRPRLCQGTAPTAAKDRG